MAKTDDDWGDAVDSAQSVGQRLAPKIPDFNSALEHIVGLLRDASLLLEQGSPATSTFLSITALEETAKVHIGLYRRSQDAVPRGKDPLFRHDVKHLIAAAPTVAMGSRLQAAIGTERMEELLKAARNGKLVRRREACLYIEQHGTKLSIPGKVTTVAVGRELLLFAVEVFDDALVGYTNHSMALRETTDAIFAKWSGGQQVDKEKVQT